MTKVYLLESYDGKDYRNGRLLLGIYSTERKAIEAKEKNKGVFPRSRSFILEVEIDNGIEGITGKEGRLLPDKFVMIKTGDEL